MERTGGYLFYFWCVVVLEEMYFIDPNYHSTVSIIYGNSSLMVVFWRSLVRCFGEQVGWDWLVLLLSFLTSHWEIDGGFLRVELDFIMGFQLQLILDHIWKGFCVHEGYGVLWADS